MTAIPNLLSHWDVASFTDKLLRLQIIWESPDKIGSSPYIKDQISLTFWGNELFKSKHGIPVKFGHKISYQVQRQISQKDAESINEIQVTLGVVLTITFLFGLVLIAGGKLLLIWMLVNSLQLIAYSPLFPTSMPSNLHYFLIDYLHLLRLNFFFQDEDLRSQSLIASPLLSICGYRQALNSSTIFILSLFFALVLSVPIFAFFDRKYRSSKQPFALKACNVMIRFSYEFLLELCTSMLILFLIDYYSPVDSSKDGSSLIVFPVICFLATLTLITFLISNIFNSKVLPRNYAPGTWFTSCWSVRPLVIEHAHCSDSIPSGNEGYESVGRRNLCVIHDIELSSPIQNPQLQSMKNCGESDHSGKAAVDDNNLSSSRSIDSRFMDSSLSSCIRE